jgi:hypothetical protein
MSLNGWSAREGIASASLRPALGRHHLPIHPESRPESILHAAVPFRRRLGATQSTGGEGAGCPPSSASRATHRRRRPRHWSTSPCSSPERQTPAAPQPRRRSGRPGKGGALPTVLTRQGAQRPGAGRPSPPAGLVR